MVLIHVALGEASAHICRVHSIPRCLVIFSRAARWFIYLLATCRSGKRTRGVKGEKMERKRKWKEGGREGQVMRNRGETERKEAMSEKECSGDDNMLMMRGAGGKTHSVVVYRLTEPMKDRGKRREEKMKTTWPRFSKLIAPRAPLLILIKRLYLAKIKSMQAPRMPLQISLDPVIHKKTSPTAERHQVVGEKRH